MKGKSRAVLTAGLGTVLSLSIATSAPAAVTGLDVGDGTLVAKGVIATVPVTFTCEAGGWYYLNITVRQVTPKKTVTGDEVEWLGGACTGEPQTVTVELRPLPSPFRKGEALADASVNCEYYDPEWGDYGSCGYASTTEEIQLSTR